jgi:hypothetical protein
MEQSIYDDKNRNLEIGDLVLLVEARDLDNDDLIHNAGDIFQFVGGMDDNIGCFIHCKTNKGTNFFADRTLKIIKKSNKMKQNNSTNFKEFLASEMAHIDAMHLTDKTYEEHYSELIQWRDFDLFHYWLRYNGVFDGGESMLNNIKTILLNS